ncbi:hypothetical protein MFLAVUS_007149 [Mucor flavus]|uniref:Protein kinase domain-containing protein n=1 Tax=Mucor flavus TaxID=439312 RepID=A0ABP9Z3I2_9FUNG
MNVVPTGLLSTACRKVYAFRHELTKGAFSTVYYAFTICAENPVAIKVIENDPTVFFYNKRVALDLSHRSVLN